MNLKFRKKKEKSLKALQKSINDLYDNRSQKKINVFALLIGGFLFLAFLTGIFLSWFENDAIVYCSIIAFLGVISVPIILVIGHESIHYNFTDIKRINKIAQNIFYFLGTSPYFWRLRHLNAHHHYTNIKEWDLDIEQSKLIRLTHSQGWRKFHRLQPYYMPVLFMMYTLNWFFLRDFADIKKQKFGNKSIDAHPLSKILLLLLSKVWHLVFLLFIPIMFGQSLSISILGFFIYHFTASITTTLVLISTHIGEDHELLNANNKSLLPYSWVEHQIRTSGCFSTKSTLALHFFGGFNHHIAHHLYPSIPYVLYPKITPLIEEYCVKNNLPFVNYPNLFTCIKSHFNRLTTFSKKPY